MSRVKFRPLVILIFLETLVKSAIKAGVEVAAKTPVSNKPETGSSSSNGLPKVAPVLKSKVTVNVAGNAINRPELLC